MRGRGDAFRHSSLPLSAVVCLFVVYLSVLAWRHLAAFHRVGALTCLALGDFRRYRRQIPLPMPAMLIVGLGLTVSRFGDIMVAPAAAQTARRVIETLPFPISLVYQRLDI